VRLLSTFANLSFDPLCYPHNGALRLCVQIRKAAFDHADVFPVAPQSRSYITGVVLVLAPDRIREWCIRSASKPAAGWAVFSTCRA